MTDYRDIHSPQLRAALIKRKELRMAFQALGREAMARELLIASRTLADCGELKDDQVWTCDKWALLRCIPALAKRLDPTVDLRPSEIIQPNDEPVQSAWLRDGRDEKLRDGIVFIMKNTDLKRFRNVSPEASDAAKLLYVFGDCESAICVAMDTIMPGTFPCRFPYRAAPDNEVLLPVSS